MPRRRYAPSTTPQAEMTRTEGRCRCFSGFFVAGGGRSSLNLAAFSVVDIVAVLAVNDG